MGTKVQDELTLEELEMLPMDYSRRDSTKVIPLKLLKYITMDFSDESTLGTDAYGTVYKGILPNGLAIAVKVLYNSNKELDDEIFKNEMHNIMNLKHDNIVRVIGYCCEAEQQLAEYKGKTVFAEKMYRILCYEYMPYGSLHTHLSDERAGLDWSTRYKIIQGICAGLKYLQDGQNPPRFHLNLTPRNIFLDDNKQPRLADFGYSILYGGRSQASNISMDAAYAPPEYRTKGLISKRFDIFSLGVVMLKIVSGHNGLVRSAEFKRQKFIDRVSKKWRNRLLFEFRSSTVDEYCQQVETCTEIALNCIKSNRRKRPNIMDITDRLNAKGVDDLQVWKMSFENLKAITKDFSHQIGKGQFGAVYKGELKGEAVAVKKLDQRSRDVQKQIESEEHLKNLEHKNIVRLIGYCHEKVQQPVESKPGQYILMDVTESLLCYEYLPKGSLEDIMWSGTQEKSPRLDWHTRYSVIKGICEGLRYLHYGCLNAPIVHRDLKPGNILLGHDMVPKLGDFGLSRIVPPDQPHITMAVGSSGYMAPETLRDTKSSEITPKSDIYSLGVLILEIITGKKCPHTEHSGKHYIENVRKHRKQNSYVASIYPSIETRFLQQAERWISIGLQCAEEIPEDRPTIEEIMHFFETESANSTDTGDGEVSKISFRELQDITKMFSAKYGESVFGAIYKGTRLDGDDMIVIKLKEQKKLSPAQFKSEVNRMKFKHNNILQLKGYCEEIHGEVRKRFLGYVVSRKQRLDTIIYGDESLNQLNWEARYKIIQGICHALKYIHEQSEDGVHMEIIPSNIWLDEEMVPKLGASGLSRLFAADPADVVGSGGYVAPEYVELTKMSTKSDIYGLGVLILEIVTGQKCLSSDSGSAASFITNVHNTWINDLRVVSKYPSLDAGCLQQVKGCIKIGVQCAQTSPERRLTAGEVVSMLEKECTSQPELWTAVVGRIAWLWE